jgi:hypothetical protein
MEAATDDAADDDAIYASNWPGEQTRRAQAAQAHDVRRAAFPPPAPAQSGTDGDVAYGDAFGQAADRAPSPRTSARISALRPRSADGPGAAAPRPARVSRVAEPDDATDEEDADLASYRA